MIGVIKGDIVHSRTLKDQSLWIAPFKELITGWGIAPENWEIFFGDTFQIEIEEIESALSKALQIKALIKKISTTDSKSQNDLDVRMAIGVGEKNYHAGKITENNGPAYIFAGEGFEQLKVWDSKLYIRTDEPDFDHRMNLYLELAAIFMDKWSISSAELVFSSLQNINFKQHELSEILQIKQNSVSDRLKRAHLKSVLKIEKEFFNHFSAKK